MMENEAWRKIMLSEELRSSIRLIEIGFGELQNIGGANDFYHLPLQLLASGLERLLKCHICYGYLESNSELPDSKHLRNCGGKTGHGLTELKEVVVRDYFKITSPVLREDLTFISKNELCSKFMDLLSEFGKFARYHNLDVVTNASKPSRDVIREWQTLEVDITLQHPGLHEKLGNQATHREACQFIDKQVIILLEKFVRAICRQFTIGRLGSLAQQHSQALSYFILLSDEKLGTRDYRKETTSYSQQKKTSHRRTWWDNIKRRYNKNYKSKRIRKAQFQGSWPFYHDEITVECRFGHWYIVTIQGYDYALHGAAQGKYNLENVTSAGMAILGESTSEFSEIAASLWYER